MREVALQIMAVLAALLVASNAWAVWHFYIDIKRNKSNGPTLALVLWFLAAANEHLYLTMLALMLSVFADRFKQYELALWFWGMGVLGLCVATFGLLLWEFGQPNDEH